MAAAWGQLVDTLRGGRWRAVWWRNFHVWQRLAGPAILGNFGEPLLYLLALGYGLGSFVGDMQGMRYIVFLASGIVVSSAMTTASFEGMYSAYTRMEVQRTWESILTTPLSVSDVVFGEAVWGATKSVFSGVAILLVATLLGAVGDARAILVLPLVLLTGLCFASMSLVVTAVSRSYDFFLYYTTLVITPMLLIGGVFFPLDRMPQAIQTAAQALPLTHAVALIRPLVIGTTPHHVVLHLLVLGLYTLTPLMLAVRLVNRRMGG